METSVLHREPEYEQEKLTSVCRDLGIRAESRYGVKKAPADEWHKTAHPYTVTLKRGKKSLTVDFYMGPAHTNEPSAADVLYSLVSDARAGDQSFEEFCSDFGYDVDSRKAEATWKVCCKLAPKVRHFLGEHFDRVANAEH